MEKLKILGTGLSGLIGTRITELLYDKYEFEDLSLATGVDVTDRNSVFSRVERSTAPILLHMAAATNVDDCEKEKAGGKKGKCWQINVEGSRNVVEAATEYNRKVIYISTDFVFEGEAESYGEEDKPSPVNWYGQTKYAAERIVRESDVGALIVRLAFPYRAEFEKEDVVRFFLHRLQAGKRVEAVGDWLITPTFIDDIAKALDVLIEQEAAGTFHTVGSSSHTPLEMARMIAEIFRLNKGLIKPVELKDIFAGKAPRPRRLVLKNDKIRKRGVKMRALEEGLEELKKQIQDKKTVMD